MEAKVVRGFENPAGKAPGPNAKFAGDGLLKMIYIKKCAAFEY